MSEQSEPPQKPTYIVWIEFGCLVAVGGLTPAVERLSAADPLSWRTIAVVVVAGLIGGANAAKAFFSSAGKQLDK